MYAYNNVEDGDDGNGLPGDAYKTTDSVGQHTQLGKSEVVSSSNGLYRHDLSNPAETLPDYSASCMVLVLLHHILY